MTKKPEVDQDVDQDGDPRLNLIYEGIDERVIPGAKYILRRYNEKTGDVEYLGLMPLRFSVDYIRETYGSGRYYLEARIKGRYIAKTEFCLARLHRPLVAQPEPAPGDGKTVPGSRSDVESGDDQLDRAIARAIRMRSVRDLLIPPGKDNGNAPARSDLEGIAKQILLKQLDKDPVKELFDTASQINSLKELFGKKRNSGQSSLTLESAIAENIPEIIDLIKKKQTQKQPEVKGRKVDDMEFVITKLYTMAKGNQPPAKGAAMILSVLPAKDIQGIAGTPPDQVAEKISSVYPQMREFLISKAGEKWLTEFCEVLRQSISSRKASPERKPKSESSGDLSEKDGPTRPSSDRQKTSSVGCRSVTRKPRRGQSIRGPKETHATPARKLKR
ncbi:hypothetical protein ES702_07391 [subsurface metagenome]